MEINNLIRSGPQANAKIAQITHDQKRTLDSAEVELVSGGDTVHISREARERLQIAEADEEARIEDQEAARVEVAREERRASKARTQRRAREPGDDDLIQA